METVIYSCQRIVQEEKFVKRQQAIIHQGKYRSGYAYQCAIERMQEYERERARMEPDTK